MTNEDGITPLMILIITIILTLVLVKANFTDAAQPLQVGTGGVVPLTEDNEYTTRIQCEVFGVDYQTHIESLR